MMSAGGQPLLDEHLTARHHGLQALPLQVASLGGIGRTSEPVEDPIEVGFQMPNSRSRVYRQPP